MGSRKARREKPATPLQPERDRQRRTALRRSPDTDRRTSGAGRQEFADTLLRRSEAALRRLVDEADAEVLRLALETPTDVGGIATLISQQVAADSATARLDPYAAALARGSLIKRALIAEAGGVLASSQVADILHISRQAVDQRARRGQLLALPGGGRARLFPVCQFENERVVDGLADVLAAFEIDDPWMQLAALLEPNPRTAGRSLIEALRSGDVESVVAVASSVGEQGAR